MQTMEKEKFYYLTDEGELSRTDKRSIYEECIDEYNRCISDSEADDKQLMYAIYDVIRNIDVSNEFLQSMVILSFIAATKSYSSTVWVYNADVAFGHGDLEICRELVIYAIKKSSVSDVKNSNKQYIKLRDEDKDQNVADILGIIVDELKLEGHLDESKCKELMEDFAKPLEKWRNLEVAKVKHKGSYDLVYEIMQLCYKHKAYHAALRLSGLLFVSDQTKEEEKLSESLFLSGKILYELGYMEAAKRCFIFADEDTDKECWKGEEEKYHDLLQQDTKLEMNEELLKKLEVLEERVNSGKLKIYTEEERKQFSAQRRAGTLELDASADPKKRKKMRTKLEKKAIAKYEKYAQGSDEERMKGIDEAFAVFNEEPEVYEAAAYLYYLKANCYLTQNDYETAYEYFQKAYKCESGKRNGLVLLGTAIVLSQMGRMQESVVYLFRTYILCGKDFIIDKCGEEPWKMIEKYLNLY